MTSSWCYFSCSSIPSISCEVVLGLECDYIQCQYFWLDDIVGRYGEWVLPFLPHPGHVMSGCPKFHDVSLVSPWQSSPSTFYLMGLASTDLVQIIFSLVVARWWFSNSFILSKPCFLCFSYPNLFFFLIVSSNLQMWTYMGAPIVWSWAGYVKINGDLYKNTDPRVPLLGFQT